jgi:hypothetical protein
MKSAHQIKKLAQSVHLAPDPKTDARILAAAEAALERTGARASESSNTLWRTIMESKLSKVAMAAVIFTVTMLVMILFDVSPDGATVAWAEVIEAMKQQRWIYLYHDNGDNISQWWLCPDEKVSIHNYNGNVTFKDFKVGLTQSYDQESNVIEIRQTIRRRDEVPFEDTQALTEIFDRPYSRLAAFSRHIDAGGYEPSVRQGDYRGHTVHIHSYESKDKALNKNDDGSWLVLYIDTETSLLRGYTEWSHCYMGADPNNLTYLGVERGENAYDYPDPGPQSIYDVGVPSDAKVIKRHDEGFLTLLPTYRRYKEEGLGRLACVLVSYDVGLAKVVTWAEKHNNPQGPISKLTDPLGPVAMEFDVFYVDGHQCREEHRFNLQENISGSKNLIRNWPRCRTELGNSFASHLAWLNLHDQETLSSIKVHDDQFRVSLTKSNGRWEFQKRSSRPWDDYHYGKLTDRTWPELDVRSEVFTDQTTEQHGLIGVKHTQRIKGHDRDDIFLYYLDPEKDFLCHKQVIKWGAGHQQIHEVETYQQVNGKWYPRQINYGIQEKGQSDVRLTECLIFYIDEVNDLPAGLFDIQALERMDGAQAK